PLHEIRTDLPATLALAVERSLEKDPADRWDSAREMRDVLDGVLTGEPAGSGALRSEPTGAGRDLPSGTPAASRATGRSPLVFPDAAPGSPGSPSSVRHSPNADIPPPVHPSPPVQMQPQWGYGESGSNGPGRETLPPYPVFPSSTNREAREQWRRQQEEWQREVQHRLATGTGVPAPVSRKRGRQHGGGKESLERFAARPLEERFRLFRRKALGTVGGISMLGFINLITFPFFPWAIFPAWGMLSGLSPQWQNLKAEGVTLGNVLDGKLPADIVKADAGRSRTALTKSEKRSLDRARAHSLWWERMPQLEKRVQSLHRWLGAAVLVPFVGTMFGAMVGEEAFVVMGFMGGGFSALIAMVKAMRLRSIGVRMRKVLRPGWRERLRLLDPRSEDAKLEAEARKLVAQDVLDSDQGVVVRQSLRERQQIARAVQLMSEDERAMIPDVLPTSDALVERVGALAQALHRLELEMPHDMLGSLEGRFRDLDRAPSGADTERRRSLLERQRATLKELEDRRVQVGGQLDSALLVLQQMKLDLLRLRSAGFQSALTSVTSATQEARALSLDIGRVLDAGEELDDHLRRSELEGSPLKDPD
ncbi:MAG TPA: hypothetical protein VKZ41_09405, partial [Gemmatimonadales bacterium]|nr:hypothetical protein [Gemmatimonadales bacterium]